MTKCDINRSVTLKKMLETRFNSSFNMLHTDSIISNRLGDKIAYAYPCGEFLVDMYNAYHTREYQRKYELEVGYSNVYAG